MTRWQWHTLGQSEYQSIEPKDAETSTRPAMEAGVWSRPILKGRLPLKGLEQFVPVK
jgi:hypothetical protein